MKTKIGMLDGLMSQDTFIIQVDCYAGYRGEETIRDT
jgi:hypothetical protein